VVENHGVVPLVLGHGRIGPVYGGDGDGLGVGRGGGEEGGGDGEVVGLVGYLYGLVGFHAGDEVVVVFLGGGVAGEAGDAVEEAAEHLEGRGWCWVSMSWNLVKEGGNVVMLETAGKCCRAFEMMKCDEADCRADESDARL